MQRHSDWRVCVNFSILNRYSAQITKREIRNKVLETDTLFETIRRLIFCDEQGKIYRHAGFHTNFISLSKYYIPNRHRWNFSSISQMILSIPLTLFKCFHATFIIISHYIFYFSSDLHHKHLFSHSSGSLKSEIKVSSRLCSFWRL